MTDLNKVTEIGRMTRDISEKDFAYTANGTARLNISIAVNESSKQNGQWVDRASFFDVTIWGKTAENLRQYLGKGKQIAVLGHLQQQRWEKDGQHFNKVVIIAEQVQLLGGNQNNQTGNTAQVQDGMSYQNNEQGFPEDLQF